MNLSSVLKHARINAGLSQVQLSEKMEYTSPQFISNWERGISQPPMKSVKKVSKILGLCPHSVARKMMEEDIERIEKKYEALCKTL